MLDHIMMILEILMLGVIVWQGEKIRLYEKWTYEMNRERYEERAQWRNQKRQQQIKKTAVSEKSLELTSPSMSAAEPSKTTDAKSAVENS